MEIDQHNLVPVEAEEEEEESLQKRRSRLPNIAAVVISSNGSTNVAYDTSNGIDSETRKGIEVDCALQTDVHGSADSEIGNNGIDLESPKKNGVERGSRLHNSVYFDQNDGTKSIDGVFETKNGIIPSSTSATNSRGVDVNNIKDLEDKSPIAELNECRRNVSNVFSDSTPTPLKDCLEEEAMKSKSFNNETVQVGDFNSIEEVDREETEFDVAKVLEKQNTHDLYCPNCNSCITRRVILRRKRKIRNPHRKTKYNKVEPNVPSEFDVVSTDSSDVQVHDAVDIHSSDSPALAADSHNSGREPEVFRCLACFSFFIPTGDGLKLFQLFGDRTPNENVQDLQKTPASNTNWFSSIFRTDKKKRAVEQGNGAEANQHGLLVSTASPSLALINDMETVSQQAREEIVIFSTIDNKYSENASTCMGEKLESATMKVDADATVSSYFVSTALEGNAECEGEIRSDSVIIHHETNATFSSSQGTPVFREETTETTSIKEAPFIDMGNKNTGNDVILLVETSPQDPAVSETQILQGNDGSIKVSSMVQTGTPTYTSGGAGVTLDILKSIVYGGLIETITSLGVVSSAAGAGSTTLNILALGLANLIGGLFIIGHNLVELKNDTSSPPSNEMSESEDRYQATLGRREKFPLHATLAIMSFLIFGMLAPVIYSFSFRKSNDKDLKLAVVGGASLVCIFLLATGKAYVRRPPKAYISTVSSYVISGIMASGVSYVVGDLISKLMEKLGWLNESSLVVPMIVPAGKPIELQWASY